MTLTAVILTYNEERHIGRCIESVAPIATRICVIDSYSTDHTVEIARSLGAAVFQNPFKNHATQFQWGLDNADINSEWTLRIDADECLEPELQQAISTFLTEPGKYNAVYFRRKIVFLGRPIMNGFFYPALILRMWRTGQGRIEQRWMDEHVQVDDPVTVTLRGDLVDENLNDLAWWTGKHVGYAKREAYEIIASREKALSIESNISGTARRKRWIKNYVYNRLPSGLRSAVYFLYRYIVGRGFLDGKEGFFFHFLQAYWYRTYVDATLFELEREAADQGLTAYQLLKQRRIL